MGGVLVLLTTAAMGVDFGWQPVAGGGFQYIIQIQPQVLEQMLTQYKAGEDPGDICSDIPPAYRGMRSYRITIGTGQLPHHGEDPPAAMSPLPRMTTPAIESTPRYPTDPARTEPRPAVGPFLNPPQLAPPSNVAVPSNPPSTVWPGTTHAAAAPLESGDRTSFGKRPTTKATVSGPRFPDEHSPSDVKPSGYNQAGQNAEARPWWPLYAALLGLFTSLGGNVFMGWVNWEQRTRYRTLLGQADSR